MKLLYPRQTIKSFTPKKIIAVDSNKDSLKICECVKDINNFDTFPCLHKTCKTCVRKIKNDFYKTKQFTRFVKGNLAFSSKGNAIFEIYKGQESYKIKPFTESNAWGLLPSGKDHFKRGDYIECFTPTGVN